MATYPHTENQHTKNRIICALMLVASGFMFLTGCGFAGAAEATSESQILRALTPSAKTRDLSATPTPQDARRQSFIASLRSPNKTRSLTLDERQEVADIAKERPSIDLEIYFD